MGGIGADAGVKECLSTAVKIQKHRSQFRGKLTPLENSGRGWCGQADFCAVFCVVSGSLSSPIGTISDWH